MHTIVVREFGEGVPNDYLVVFHYGEHEHQYRVIKSYLTFENAVDLVQKLNSQRG